MIILSVNDTGDLAEAKLPSKKEVTFYLTIYNIKRIYKRISLNSLLENIKCTKENIKELENISHTKQLSETDKGVLRILREKLADLVFKKASISREIQELNIEIINTEDILRDY
jgi:hypothetical protein